MAKRIPLIDIAAGYLELQTDLEDAARRVMCSGQYILGPEVAAFEGEFSAYCGSRYCVAVSNGTDALRMILEAYEIGSGDEVIVPAHTFIATWLAVVHAGARPVPADIGRNDFNIDPARVEELITERTRAILPVHLYGQPAEMGALQEIASRRGLLLIEDAAQAHGAVYRGKMAGSLGHAAAFSFYPTKNLGALGDAGAIVCDNPRVVEKLQHLRHVGRDAGGVHRIPGHNCRMDELQAALLRVKLPYLETWNQRRREIAENYITELSDLGLHLPEVHQDIWPVWHLFVIRTHWRDKLQDLLQEQGIEARVHYPSTPYLYPALSTTGYGPGTCPRAEAAVAEALSLPLWPQMTWEQVSAVTTAVKKVLAHLGAEAR